MDYIKEICYCCHGSGKGLDIEDNVGACMTCNGEGYYKVKISYLFKNEAAGILYYKIKSKGGVCGQQVGADGSGAFMEIYYGDKSNAYKEARKLLDDVVKNHTLIYADYVENSEGYYGSIITYHKGE